MKRLFMLVLGLFVVAMATQAESPYKANFVPGPVDIKTMGAMTSGTIFCSE